MSEREEAKQNFLLKAFEWDRWPKLAGIFRERPRINVYWQELADFVVSLPGYLIEVEREPPYVQIRDELAAERSRVNEAERERDEARDWVRRMHADRQALTCVFCGEAYPPGTAASGEPALVAHVEKCPKHPLAAARRDLETRDAEVWAARELLFGSDVGDECVGIGLGSAECSYSKSIPPCWEHRRRAFVARTPEATTPAVPGRLAPIEDGEWCHFCCGWSESDDEGSCTSCGDDNIVPRQFRRIPVDAPQPKPSASLMPREDAGTLPSLPLPAEEERDPDVRPTWDERGLPLCDDACPNFDGKRCKATGFRPDRFCEPELIRLSALREGQGGRSPEGMEPNSESVPAEPSASLGESGTRETALSHDWIVGRPASPGASPVSAGSPDERVREAIERLASKPRGTRHYCPGCDGGCDACRSLPPQETTGQQESLASSAICPRCHDRVTTKSEAGPPWNGKTVFVQHAAKGASPRVWCRESGQEPPAAVPTKKEEPSHG